MDEQEFDKMMEERYKNNPGFRNAEDADEAKRSMERNFLEPSAKDPTVWKVKCMVGRERHSSFCLMQKFVDLKSLGTKLQIISAFAIDHVKGFLYIEADKQIDIIQACKGLCSIYSSRVAPVPKNEVSHLISIRRGCNQVTEGTWARVKNGNYKGDLAQIVAVNDVRKKATVKLIPRIDFQALAQKFVRRLLNSRAAFFDRFATLGGGLAKKKAAIPAPRLISSSELEEFRPLIQYKRDRDTGKMFEVLDGLMLKDGYLYKRVSIDSLSCLGVIPSEEELLKFKPSENNESENLEWLAQIYVGQKKKQVIGNEKGADKGESSLSSGQKFEVYNLVCFGRKDFGLVVGMEKDDSYKILKHGLEKPDVVTVALRDLKNGPTDMKFTALDHHKKIISVNDTVKVLEGPLKARGYHAVALCRIGKELLSKSTEASYLYMIRMKQKMVVISVRKLKCVRKSSFLLMHAVERMENQAL